MKNLAKITFLQLVVLLALGLAAVLLLTNEDVPDWLVGLVLLAQLGTPTASATLARARQEPRT
jgi:uncharacterized membrane protein YcaP (DUF421 family)